MGKMAGTRDTLNKRFLKDLVADWDEHGQEAIVEMRQKNPTAYVCMVAGLQPKEIEVKNPFDGLAENELIAAIEYLQSQLGAESLSAGAIEATGGEQAQPVPALPEAT